MKGFSTKRNNLLHNNSSYAVHLNNNLSKPNSEPQTSVDLYLESCMDFYPEIKSSLLSLNRKHKNTRLNFSFI